jgi:hypothetical protein
MIALDCRMVLTNSARQSDLHPFRGYPLIEGLRCNPTGQHHGETRSTAQRARRALYELLRADTR